MKHMKPLFWLLLILVGSVPAYSQAETPPATDEAPVIDFVVWTHSGEKIAYRLSEHPVVTQSGDKLILTTNTGIVEYAASDVRKFTFEPIYYFVAWLNDGSRTAYALGQHPVVTYTNGELLLTTTQQQVTYAACDVRRFTFSASDISCDAPTSVTSPLEQGQQFNLQQGNVRFSGSPAGSTITVYTIDGKLLHTTTTDEAGNATIDIASYPAGIYIIKTETITHKIIKR